MTKEVITINGRNKGRSNTIILSLGRTSGNHGTISAMFSYGKLAGCSLHMTRTGAHGEQIENVEHIRNEQKYSQTTSRHTNDYFKYAPAVQLYNEEGIQARLVEAIALLHHQTTFPDATLDTFRQGTALLQKQPPETTPDTAEESDLSRMIL